MCVVQNLYTKAKCKEKKSCDLKHIGEFKVQWWYNTNNLHENLQ